MGRHLSFFIARWRTLMGEAEPRRSESGALSTRRLQLRPLRAQDGVVLAELAALHAVRRDLSLALFAVLTLKGQQAAGRVESMPAKYV